jgi:hypothetical protein
VDSRSQQKRRTAVYHAVRVSKHGASWLYDFIASQLVGVALTVLFVALGVGYKADDSRVNKAAVLAATQAGSTDIADGYAAFAREVNAVKEWALDEVPEAWREEVSRLSIVFATLALVGGCTLALVRAPSRAHVLRDLGWGIALPGIIAAAATAVLEWRAMKGIRATLSGDRTARTLWTEGSAAAWEAFPALGPALGVGAILLFLGISLHRRWQRAHDEPFTARHVVSHFFVIAGVVPWIHVLAVVVFGALTKGSSTGTSLAPWVHNRPAYLACVGLFSFGAALFLASWREVRRLDRAEARDEERGTSSPSKNGS